MGNTMTYVMTEQARPFFSIVIPVYNAAQYLEKSLKSVLVQSFTDFELILIDDCSEDESLSLCEKYAVKDKRIIIIKNKVNCGASEARNIGIHEAKGCFLCFADADDYIEPDFLDVFYHTLQEGDFDLVKIGAFEEYYDQTDSLIYTRECILPDRTIYDKNEILDQAIEMEMIPLFGYVWNGLYKIELIKNNGLRFNKELKVNEDFSFNICYLPFVNKMKILAYCGYHYAKRNNKSLSGERSNYDFEKHLLKINGFLQMLEVNNNKTQVNLDKVYWLLTRFAFSALGNGERLDDIQNNAIYKSFQKHVFKTVDLKKKILTAILKSNNALLISLVISMMQFVRQNLPVVFAKLKR